MKTLYTAEAVVTGEGRDGHARSSDGVLDFDLAVPTERGGRGGATNPEQLFAAGYAACFHSALRTIARREKTDLGESTITAQVGIGPNENRGFGLEVKLVVDLPGFERDEAQRLVEAAHQVCPYSNATRGNIDVQLEVA
jgi:Ohr subfamily peroxiredoxin